MFIRYNRKLREVARQMRNNPTPYEKEMWDFLRKDFPEFDFSRQVPMDNFIVDFHCKKKSLVVEVDGEIHNNQKERDAGRDNILSLKFGLRILRFKNNDVSKDKEYLRKALSEALHSEVPFEGDST